MDMAAQRGQLEAMRWLHKYRPEGCTTSAMSYAAGNGGLHVVQWLNEHRPESCSAKVMDCAAAKGHLEIVKWLYEHRRAESCVTTAMISAAVEGELDVLVWLHENTLEGCTTCVLDQLLQEPALYAQKPKRRLFPHESEDVPVLNTLRWLRDHPKARPSCARRCFQRPGWGLDRRLSTIAAYRGDVQLLAYLHECFSFKLRLHEGFGAVPSLLVSDMPFPRGPVGVHALPERVRLEDREHGGHVQAGVRSAWRAFAHEGGQSKQRNGDGDMSDLFSDTNKGLRYHDRDDDDG